MTFNLLAKNRSGEGALSRIIAGSAEVVAVQELGAAMASVLVAGLRESHPHQVFHAAGVTGCGVFSRYPISSELTFRLSEVGNIGQRVTIHLPTGDFQLFNVHLTAPRIRRTFRYDHRWREIEAANLVGQIRAAGQASIVLAGDFNMTARSETYRLIAGVLADSHRGAPCGRSRTFPNGGRGTLFGMPRWLVPFPIIRIDYIFHSSDIQCLSTRSADGDGSDHCPVVARLKV